MATALEPKRMAEAERVGSDRSFGYVFAAVFALIGLYPLWWLQSPRLWSLVIAATFALFAFLFPHLLHPLNRAWLAFGRLLHKIVSPLVMGAVFFLVVTPTALIMRLRGRDLLSRRWHPEQSSYWVEREVLAQPPSETMKKQF
jgi:Saxitoxin biosynthesis operon protein SxtJ